ncbi:CFEM domain-containing protein [Purpureocillium lilacinum]|uniref:CFEM domain-containing protein n=1 Tax=Purpureocillium lilacinum TaxID=33203 RepID=A0A179GYR8_PURLI|nr:CFEM domain-containing protein [Purpureocillium lilacinum]
MVRFRLQDALPLLAASSAVALDPDFSFYPKNAQSCLKSAASKSKCSGSTAKELNTCFCGNKGNFITNTAKCLGKEDMADVQSVYATILQACTGSNTPMSVSQSDFIKAANGQDSPTTTITTMPTSTILPTKTSSTSTPAGGAQTVTVTPTTTGSGGGGRLSTGATIGIAVGTTLVGVAVLGGLGFLLFRRHKRGNVEESRPMLVHPEYYHHMTGMTTTTTFPAKDPSIDLGRFSGATDSKSGAWSPSSGPGSATHTSPGPYPSAFTPSPPPADAIALAELPAVRDTSEVFEMDATSPRKASDAPSASVSRGFQVSGAPATVPPVTGHFGKRNPDCNAPA